MCVATSKDFAQSKRLVLSGNYNEQHPKQLCCTGPHLHGVLAAKEQCLCAELIHIRRPAGRNNKFKLSTAFGVRSTAMVG